MNGIPEAKMSEDAQSVNLPIGTEKRSENKNIIGKRFYKVVVIGKDRQNKEHRWAYKCLCDCGQYTTAYKNQLEHGHKKSCGCIKSEAHMTHGLTKTKEYRTWKGIKERCHNENSKDYVRYGAKGISICNRWEASFVNFLSDMGTAPSEIHQIDRKDNLGNYEPNNCRWATPREQSCNKRNSKIWHIMGHVFDSAISAAKTFGVHESTIWAWCTGKNRTKIRPDCYFEERYPK